MSAKKPPEPTKAERMAAVQQCLEAVREVDDAAPTGLVVLIERMARDPAVDVDKFERFLAMHERLQVRAAEEAFHRALSLAQGEMRQVATDAVNPQTKSRYASYAAIDLALRPIYTSHGFGLSFDTADTPLASHLRVVCYVSHQAGHAKAYHVDLPADGKGAKGGDVMTLTHAAGAAMSYGMRYLVKMIFNVAIGEDDRDGNDPPVRPVVVPAGFDDWWLDLQSVALSGRDELQKAWKASKLEYRKHLTDTNNTAWEALKRTVVS